MTKIEQKRQKKVKYNMLINLFKKNAIHFVSGGPGAVVEAACLQSRRSRVQTPLWLPSFKEAKCFFPSHSKIFNIVGSLRDREVACSASDHHGSHFGARVWRVVSSHIAGGSLMMHQHAGNEKNII